MAFASRLWKLLMAVKDGLVLLAMLLFFLLLYGVLTARAPASGAGMKDGALLIRLNGVVVEELSDVNPLNAALGESSTGVRERDVVRALHEAAGDSRIKAVVLDLTRFSGGGLVHLEEIGAAMDAVRAAKKPVLTYGMVLEDGGTLLAAHASEAWLDPLGGAFLPGPGGYQLYYAKLLDRLKITAHIFRVGTYKDFVEPYFRNDASAPSKAARQELYAAIWSEVKANIAHARPKARLDLVTADPVGWFKAAGGDGAKAALTAGLVDRVGTRAEFGDRVAALAGKDDDDPRPGAYAHTGLATFLAAHPASTDGKAVAVVTVAGNIVDGKAGPGTAGGDRIAALIDKALGEKAAGRKDIAALVVRVDSPGGSVTGAEAIRRAILRARAQGLPVVVSMANMAASGGYWVSTPGTLIFAEPGTVTGSIGIFAVIPSFEKLLASYGVTGDGVRTTPLSGQPDPLTGLTPEVEAMLQADIDNGYARFIGLVAASRHKTPDQVDAVAQGRVWDGATARRLGLVDRFGGLDDALTAAAAAAHLGAGQWHSEFLGTQPRRPLMRLLDALKSGDGEDDAVARDWVGLVAARQRELLARALGDTAQLLNGSGAQAYCLACAGLTPHTPAPASETPGWLARVAAFLS